MGSALALVALSNIVRHTAYGSVRASTTEGGKLMAGNGAVLHRSVGGVEQQQIHVSCRAQASYRPCDEGIAPI
jgi:hypothetical protein